MKFRYVVEIEVKNDAVTQDCGRQDLAMIILAGLEDNHIKHMPWVIQQHYLHIPEKNGQSS